MTLLRIGTICVYGKKILLGMMWLAIYNKRFELTPGLTAFFAAIAAITRFFRSSRTQRSYGNQASASVTFLVIFILLSY